MNKIKKIILGVLALFSFMGEGLWASQRDLIQEWNGLADTRKKTKIKKLYNDFYKKHEIAENDKIIETLMSKNKIPIDLIYILFLRSFLIIRKKDNSEDNSENSKADDNEVKKELTLFSQLSNKKDKLFSPEFQKNFIIIDIYQLVDNKKQAK